MPCPSPHMGLSLELSLSRHFSFIYTHSLPHYPLQLGQLSCLTCQPASLPPLSLPSEPSEHRQRHSCKVKSTAEHLSYQIQALTSCWAHRFFVTWSVTTLHLLCLPTKHGGVQLCVGGGRHGQEQQRLLSLAFLSLAVFLLSSCLFLKTGSHSKAFTGLDQ